MAQIGYDTKSADRWLKQLIVEPKTPEIDWAYKIQYGKRPSKMLG